MWTGLQRDDILIQADMQKSLARAIQVDRRFKRLHLLVQELFNLEIQERILQMELSLHWVDRTVARREVWMGLMAGTAEGFSPLFDICTPMRLILWNCCGAGRANFVLMLAFLGSDLILIWWKLSINEGWAAVIYKIPNVGFSGGLWILKLCLRITNSLIHCIIKFELSWMVVYGYVCKKAQWEWQGKSMKHVDQINTLPWWYEWCEQLWREKGNHPPLYTGADFSISESTIVICWIWSANHSIHVTRSRKRNGRVIIRELLDRALANVLGRNYFPEATVTNLPKTTSDDHPIFPFVLMPWA